MLQFGDCPSMQKLHFANPHTGTNVELRQNGSGASLAEPFQDRTNCARSSWIENTQVNEYKNRFVMTAYPRR